MLVLIDGRTVYTPLFSRLLGRSGRVAEDIDRIEIIRAPAPPLGANAVNGVINILTKSAADPRGRWSASAAARGAGPRQLPPGGQAGGGDRLPPYGKYSYRDSLAFATATAPAIRFAAGRRDSVSTARPRLRALTLQGTPITGSPAAGHHAGDPDLDGANLLGRWTHTYAAIQARTSSLLHYTHRGSRSGSEPATRWTSTTSTGSDRRAAGLVWGAGTESPTTRWATARGVVPPRERAQTC